MKSGILGFLDDAVSYVEKNMYYIEQATQSLERFFQDTFDAEDYFLNMASRIKSENSLKEKIIRHNFFRHYKNPKNVIDHFSDLIGIRIECRFIQDEENVYRKLKELFTEAVDDVYYRSSLNDNILLNLADEQPRSQKNGFKMYRLDGKYCFPDRTFNFELQIKSLVNNFWGEIDHRILYKNYNYMLTEDLIREIMFAVNQNLATIDSQLQVVYNYLNEQETQGDTMSRQLKTILSKLVHDMFVVKLRDGTGLILDFRTQTNLISDYIYAKVQYSETQDYSGNSIRILTRLNELSATSMDFGEYLEIEYTTEHKDELHRRLAEGLREMVNVDFIWNMIFSIIFEIENEDRAGEFSNFIDYMIYSVTKCVRDALSSSKLPDEKKEKVLDRVVALLFEHFCRDYSSEHFTSERLEHLTTILSEEISTLEHVREEDYQLLAKRIRKEL